MPKSIPTKRQNRSAAAAACATGGEDDMDDVASVASSVGSRSSARLKRKRESGGGGAAAAAAPAHPFPEEEEDDDEDGPNDESPAVGSPMGRARSGKRRRVVAAVATGGTNVASGRGAFADGEHVDRFDYLDVALCADGKRHATAAASARALAAAAAAAAATTGHAATTTFESSDSRSHHPGRAFLPAAATITTTTTVAAHRNWRPPSISPAALAAAPAAAATGTIPLPPQAAAAAAAANTTSAPRRRGAAAAGGGRLMLDAAPTPLKPAPLAAAKDNGDDDDNTTHQHHNHHHQRHGVGAGDDALAVLRARTTVFVAQTAAATGRWFRRVRGLRVDENDDEENEDDYTIVDGGRGDATTGNGRGDDSAARNISSPLDRTGVWFLIGLLLQIVFFPLWIHPILSTTVALSNTCLAVYRGGIAPRPPTPRAAAAVDAGAAAAAALHALHAEWQAVGRDEDEARRQHAAATAVLQRDLARHETRIRRRSHSLTALVDQLTLLTILDEPLLRNPLVTVVGGLLAAASDDDDDDDTGHRSGSSPHNSVGGDSSKSSSNRRRTLLDLSALELWPVATAVYGNNASAVSCAPDSDLEDGFSDTILQRPDLESALAQLQTDAKEAAFALRDDPDSVKAAHTWIRDTMHQELGRLKKTTTTSDDMTNASTMGDKKHGTKGDTALRRTIDAQLEMDGAGDETGRIDYASVRHGAAVVAASPTLRDTLPVLNRLAALLRLRFYGYGPDAALTPTQPRHALGQCWAFLARRQPGVAAELERDRNAGPMAQLTVRLGRPIHVQSVVIEHPPPELSDHGGATAVRRFTVVGYELYDPGGSGESAWPLGTYEFDPAQAGAGVQEFAVAADDDDDRTKNGGKIPALHVIRLQVDSNWGADYACLYRFRVHGQEAK